MVQLSYPGVYIEEISSGVHTITGVATSIAAFIGWAPKGPTNEAVLVQSWMDFAAQFGGLDSRSLLGYSVNQFFANGGSQAYIIRLAWDSKLTAVSGAPKAAVSASHKSVGGTLDLFATSPGKWGSSLQVIVTVSPADATRFSLQIQDPQGNSLENFANLSVDPHDAKGRYVVTVIDNDSQYVTFIDPAHPNTPPTAPTGTPTTTASAVALTGGDDGDPLAPADGNFEAALGLTPVAGPPYGLHLLDQVDIFNLLCVPGETDAATIQNLQQYCHDKRAFYIVDCPRDIKISDILKDGPVGTKAGAVDTTDSLSTEPKSSYSAYYYPWVEAPDPLAGNRPTLYPPCGFVAGIYAATDADRGVWKAPAGIQAGLTGVTGLQVTLTDLQNGTLNQQAVNCLRQFKIYGDVVWGARTLDGNDQVGSQWKYVPIRRLALFLESSLYNGTKWVVFEPNDEPLWSQIRLNVGVFMHGLFRQGAFQGKTPQQAYFVKCDAENNPQSSIDMGIVNILVGFAPLYPAEFVVIQIQQMAGQLQA